LDEDHEAKDEESERDKNKNNDSMKNSIKSRKAFQMAINDKSVPPAIQRLSRIANIVLLALIAIAIVDYSIHYKQLKDTIENFKVIENAYTRLSEVNKVCYNVRTMIMLNQNILTNYYGFKTKADFITNIKGDL